MAHRRAKLWATVALVAVVLATVAVLAAGPRLGLPPFFSWLRPSSPASTEPQETPGVELVSGATDTLQLSPDVARLLGVQTVEARLNTQPRLLELRGRLALDSNHLARVHTRFPGEVIQIEEIAVARDSLPIERRPLRVGDQVKAGERLAVVWSKDLGEKKSELVDVLSQLRLDEENLEKLLAAGSAVPEATVRQARRSVESDRIAVARAERTLRSWRLTEEEIAAVKAEAERIRQRPAGDSSRDRDWAKVEVRTRIGGTVVEKNVTLGDIVDTTTDLFKVADMTHLAVWADAYEEDLPALLAVPPAQLHWTVRLLDDPSARALEGDIDYIGSIIDPTQHTALVVGRVDNPDGRLRAGQFVTATVELPAPRDEIVIPASALIEDGRSAVVFVQPDPNKPRYELRRIAVARRLPGVVLVRGRLTPEQEKHGVRRLRPGERVVRSGAVELKKALEDLEAAAKPAG